MASGGGEAQEGQWSVLEAAEGPGQVRTKKVTLNLASRDPCVCGGVDFMAQ